MSIFEADQLHAAQTETRNLLATAYPHTIRQTTEDPWVADLLGRLVQPGLQLCRHISKRPVQPAFVHSHERNIRCTGCHTRHQPTPDRRTCDRCGSNGTLDALHPTLITIPPWVVIATLCDPCEAPYLEAGTP